MAKRQPKKPKPLEVIRDRIVDFRRIPARDLLANPKNWRTHPEQQASALSGLLREIGFADALIARDTPRGVEILDGHLRAELAPDTSVPVLIVDLDDAEAEKFLLTFDPVAGMADGDTEALRRLLISVVTEDESVARLMRDIAREYKVPLDQREIQDPGPRLSEADALRKKWGVELGQIWELGDHRLMCGDATDPASVRRLMQGMRAALFATDPPYLVDYDGTNHPGSAEGNHRESVNKDWSGSYRDFDRASQGDGLYDGYMRAAKAEAIVENAAWYCWHAFKRQDMVREKLEQNGVLVHQQIIWVKDRATLTRAWYSWAHEPCFFGWIEGRKPYRASNEVLKSVWLIEGIAGSDRPDHPTPKPLECFAIPMRQHTIQGDICYEPFSGSGSQIIAGERELRRVYAMELAPEFVAVAIERWAEATSRRPRLVTGVAEEVRPESADVPARGLALPPAEPEVEAVADGG